MGRQELVLKSDVAAAPADVWKIVADPNTYHKWMPGVQKVDLGATKAVQKGARFKLVTAVGTSKLVSDCEITGFDQERSFAWAHRKDVLDGEPFDMMKEARSEFEVQKKGDGTHLVARISFEPQGLRAKLAAGLFMNKTIKPQMEKALERLRKLVE